MASTSSRTTRRSVSSLPFRILIATSALLALGLTPAAAENGATEVAVAATPPLPAGTYTLDACLAEALKNNHRRPASKFAVAAAEAQLQQALSANWPQLILKGGYRHSDEAPNFVFPASVMGVPGQTITTPATTALVTVPAGIFGPSPVQLPVAVPSQTISTQPLLFAVPAQDVKLMDPDIYTANLDVRWLLSDGGMRRGLRQQAEAQIAAMKEESRRTDLEVADSVRRIYHGAVLAHQLRHVGDETLARMEATLNLTETMYKEGGGKVTKADFLDNKVMVESLRAMVASLEKNEAMARAALANTMGLPWSVDVTPSAEEIPFVAFDAQLADLVGTAYRFNPDWKKLEAGLSALDGGVRTARSGYAPKVALVGELHKYWNDYDAGIVSDRNKEGWTVGVGFELPIFDGKLTRGRVAEARARLEQLKEQGILLREGIGLQVKDIFLGLSAARKAQEATGAAMEAAVENRDLNTRAYQNELVETEKVIRAQLVEALMTAQHLKARYDYAVLQSQLNLTVGTEVLSQLHLQP